MSISVNARIHLLLVERAEKNPGLLFDYISEDDQQTLVGDVLSAKLLPLSDEAKERLHERAQDILNRVLNNFINDNWQSGEKEFADYLRDNAADARADAMQEAA